MKARVTVRLAGLGKMRDSRRRTRIVEEEFARFITERYDRLSKGGGEWPNTRRGPPIMVLSGLTRQAVGEGVTFTPSTQRVSLKTRRYHPRAKMTVKQLLRIHHFGGGRLPSRKVLVPPDRAFYARVKRRLG